MTLLVISCASIKVVNTVQIPDGWLEKLTPAQIAAISDGGPILWIDVDAKLTRTDGTTVYTQAKIPLDLIPK